jgi:Tol biopolymer transport system component
LNDAAKGRPKNFNRDSLGMAFVLTRVEGAPLCMSDANGSDSHLFFDVPEYTHCRTPAWSPDGTKVAFVVIRSLFGEKRAESRIMVVDAEGGAPKELGIGVVPSWSPDGKRIAFTGVGSTPPGTYVMNADGTEVQQIDANAQYGKWSPKNDELACIVGGNLCIYDLKTKKQTKLLNADYQEILWGFGWSPDGQWICFKGTSPEGRNVAAVVHREGQSKGFRVLLPSQESPDVVDFTCHFAWEPTEGKRILASLSTQQNRNYQLYLLDPERKEPPTRLAGQDSSRSWSSGTWSPDGKRIIFCVYGANPDLGILE